MLDDKELAEYAISAMRTRLRNTKDIEFYKDAKLNYVAASGPFLELVNRSLDFDIFGYNDYDLFSPDLAGKYVHDDQKMLQTGNSLLEEVEFIPGENGCIKYASTSKYPIRDKDGKIIGLYGLSRDITAEIELEMERERVRMSSLLFEDMIEADVTKNKFIRASGSYWSRKLQFSVDCDFDEAAQLMSETLIHPKYRRDFLDTFEIKHLELLYKAGIHEFEHMAYMSDNGKDYIWISYITQLHWSDISQTLRFTSFLRNRDNDIKMKEQLIQKAETDSLTGLLNRKSIFQKIEEALAKKDLSQMYALLFIDLDYFKNINDTYGHPMGDKVLKMTGDRLKDIFPDGNFVGRIGGDEFLVFINKATSQQAVEDKARDVIDRLREYWSRQSEVENVTYSIGVALYKEGKSLEQLYAEADRAMYKAKRSGRDTVSFFQ